MTVRDNAPDSDKLTLILEEVRYTREDVRDNRAAIDSLRGDMTTELHRVHDRIDDNVSKISRNSQSLAVSHDRRFAWKKWTAIVGSVAGVGMLVYTLVNAFASKGS